MTSLYTANVSAQGVPPGGPIGNSTGIGSGLGGVTGGTGPGWPNGTNQAPQPSITLITPGGGTLPSAPPPAALSTARPNNYPQPSSVYATHQRKPSVVPMTPPPAETASLAFLKGCWRTDVFLYEQQHGLTTWCFNDKGVGRVLYTRIDQPAYSCNAQAEARYSGGVLSLQSLAPTCSDGRSLPLGNLDCRQNGEIVQCSGTLPARGPAETWSVGLYRVPR
ncbi:MAG TPA: hypothetical protein VFB13_14120 [Reyranella sp.]|nr:hypothetical protein [Reyranella sp.]